MDFLLILYFCLFFAILFFPFYWIHKTKLDQTEQRDEPNNLLQRRRLLLENLKDLKTDMETGKLSKEELEQSSSEIISELEEIDKS